MKLLTAMCNFGGIRKICSTYDYSNMHCDIPQYYLLSESALALLSRDGRSKSIGRYKLKTLLSLLPLLYRFSEGYSESLHLHSRDKNVQKSKVHALTYEKNDI